MKSKLILILVFAFSSLPIFAQYEPWVQIMKGIDIPNLNIPLLSSTEELIYACDIFQGLFSSSDNGNNWKFVGPEFLDSSAINANIFATSLLTFDHTIIIGNASYGLYLSSDDGNNWTQINIDPVLFPPDTLWDTYPYTYGYVVESLIKNDTFIFAATTKDGIYRSSDKGLTWSRTNYGGIEAIRYMYSSGKNIYAGGEHFAFKSTDNGDTWVDLLSTPYLIKTMAVNDDGVHFAGMYTQGLIKSTDDGASWVKTNLPNMGVYDIEFYKEFVIINAYGKFKGSGWDEAGVFLSPDNGDSWRKIGINDAYLNPKTILVKDDYIFASNDVKDSVKDGNLYTHNSIFRAKISDLITDVKDDAPTSDISIYPNPARDYIYINSSLINGAGGVWQYQIYDILGNCVQNGTIESNKININQLSSGFYTVRFFSAGKQVIEKMMKE